MKKLLLAALLALTPAFASAQVTTKQGAAVVDGTSLRTTCYAAFDVAGYTTPTDLWALTGSATTTVRLVSVELSGTATASTSSDVILVKRSSANSGGTPTSITPVQSDSADAPCTATVVKYGAAPTTGTLVAELKGAQITMPPAASSTPALTYLSWLFGTPNSKPAVLRGVNEVAALNFQGAALPAGMRISVSIVWTEE